ncbi:MAG: hypothetical protein IIV66_04455 [Alistipes sp.]|nr:hypothetical protein [Alistipes sp.]
MKKYLLAFVALMGITTLVAQETTKSLYVIDGKVVSKAEFDQLNPETIQNVDIFKNIEGAVVVTTKSNASGVEGLRGKLQSKTVRINKQDGSAMVEENDEKVLVIGGQSSVVTTTKSKKTEVADPLILQKKKDGEVKVLSPDAIKKMDPNTIQAVSVLKDTTAEAYAKYGDVTNGVIVIELK